MKLSGEMNTEHMAEVRASSLRLHCVNFQSVARASFLSALGPLPYDSLTRIKPPALLLPPPLLHK